MGGNLAVFAVNFDFLDFWPLGGRECVQNDATGCGIIFHTRPAPPQKLDFSSIFAGAAAAAEQSQVGRPPQPSCPGMKYPVRDHPLTPTQLDVRMCFMF